MPVLKMLSRQRLSAIQHTLEYINKEHAGGLVEPTLHNLRSHDKEGIVKEMMENEAYRKVTSNRVYCYHSILSLSELDKAQATPKVMRALAQKYFELRGDILGFAVPHFDTDSPHLHILESATYYRENKASGLRKSELHQLKLDLEGFVKERFPELEHSLVIHGVGKEYQKEIEQQLIKRSGSSEKAQLHRLVQKAYTTASSKKQFLDILLDYGYVHYERNTDGIATGVISESGRKYRFKTLGLLPEQIRELENHQEKSKEQNLLEQLKCIRDNNKPKTLEK